jgi:hypothetical protein
LCDDGRRGVHTLPNTLTYLLVPGTDLTSHFNCFIRNLQKNNSLYIAISNRFLWILSLMHKHFGAGIQLKICILLAGLFSNHGPLYFYDTKKHFTKLGLPCHIAKIHSEVIT